MVVISRSYRHSGIIAYLSRGEKVWCRRFRCRDQTDHACRGSKPPQELRPGTSFRLVITFHMFDAVGIPRRAWCHSVLLTHPGGPPQAGTGGQKRRRRARRGGGLTDRRMQIDRAKVGGYPPAESPVRSLLVQPPELFQPAGNRKGMEPISREG